MTTTCNFKSARDKSRVQERMVSIFPSHWLKNWREIFKPITECSNGNRVSSFDSHLKTALNNVH